MVMVKSRFSPMTLIRYGVISDLKLKQTKVFEVLGARGELALMVEGEAFMSIPITYPTLFQDQNLENFTNISSEMNSTHPSDLTLIPSKCPRSLDPINIVTYYIRKFKRYQHCVVFRFLSK